MISVLAERPPLRPTDLVGRKAVEAQMTRARAHWDARRRFWFDVARLIDDTRRLRLSEPIHDRRTTA